MSEEKFNIWTDEKINIDDVGGSNLKKLLQKLTTLLPKDICNQLVVSVSTDFLAYNRERLANLKTADIPEKKIIIATSTEYTSEAYDLFADSMKYADLSTECKMIMINTMMMFKRMKDELNFVKSTSVHEFRLKITDKDSIDRLIEDIQNETQLVNEKIMNIISKNIHSYF
ncbi:MAG TPA: hypothetical protein DCW90_09005 [Lachnospiraceae bacterium]|nr:hypothetical protein [Lachnospiraceae bacterium]